MIYEVQVGKYRWDVHAMIYMDEKNCVKVCNKVNYSVTGEYYYCYIQIDIGPYYPEKFVLVALARGLDIINKEREK